MESNYLILYFPFNVFLTMISPVFLFLHFCVSVFLSLHVSDGLVTRVTPPTPVPGQSQHKWVNDGHKSYTDL